MTDPGFDWIASLITAYYDNCVTLMVLRGDEPKRCLAGIE